VRINLTDLVDVEGSREVTAPVAPTPSRAPRTAGFDADLRLLRRRVIRSWALAAAVRYAIVALAVAVVPAALAAFGAIDWIWALVVPAAVFIVLLCARLLRPPSTAQVARLLDERLGLFDVTATALEIERRGEPVDEGPAAPVFAEAAALLHAGAESWRPRPRLRRAHLSAGAGLLALLAAIVVAGTVSQSSGQGSGTTVAVARQAARERSRLQNVSPPLAPPRAKRHRPGEGPLSGTEHRSPLGLYAFGYEGRRPLPKIESTRHAGLYTRNPSHPGGQPGSFAAGAPTTSSAGREKAEEEANGTKAAAGEEKQREGEGKAPESLKSLTGGRAPSTGSVSALPGANSASTVRPTSGAPHGSSGKSGSAGSNGPGGGGAPSTGGGAGHQRASIGRGEEGRRSKSGAGELPLRAGFAAAHPGKPAGGHGPRNAQGGGGQGLSAGVAGGAFEEAGAGSLGYVPPDAGVAATLDPGLFARYLNALAQIAGRQW
jgi:uncharacterized membrane protein YgcG